MPAREALLRLANEGYLVGTSRGFVTPRLSLEDIREIFEVRRLLEPRAAANAARDLTPADEAKLTAAITDARAAARADDIERLILANIAFRAAWLGAVRNRRLAETIARFVDHVQTVRLGTLADPQTRNVVSEGLEGLYRAFRARDAAAAHDHMAGFMAPPSRPSSPSARRRSSAAARRKEQQHEREGQSAERAEPLQARRLLHERGWRPRHHRRPERWRARWDDNLTAARIADRAGLEFMLPIARWRGFGGKNRVREHSFETFTWAAGLASATERIGLFMTVHVPIVHPVYAPRRRDRRSHLGRRAGLNIVCGWNPDEFAMFGVKLGDDAYGQAGEWIDVIDRCYGTAQPFDFDGKYYQLKGVVSRPPASRLPAP